MKKGFMLLLVGLCFVPLLAACDGDSFQANSLGYDFVMTTLKPDAHRSITISPSHAKIIAHLRPYGIGVPPENFISQYSQPLVPSQPPTQLWFKATLDDFPAGSVMIVGFDRSSDDSAPRANLISYVAGDNHPTTDTQAETIAESFLPDDTSGPVLINSYNAHTNVCQSEYYSSITLAALFPAQDFLDANGKIAKAGTITLSLFPHYPRTRDVQDGTVSENRLNGPDQPNGVSSFLLTLGTKPYC